MDRAAPSSCVIDAKPAGRNLSDATQHVHMWQYVVYEINVLMWAALVSVTWVLMKRLWSLGTLWLKAARLPGPPASHFAKYATFDNYTEYFRALHKEYGPVVRVWLGPTRALVSLKNQSLARELLVRARDRDLRTCKTMERTFGKGSLSAGTYAQAKLKRFPLYEKLNGKLLESVHPAAVRVAGQLERWVQPAKDESRMDRKQLSDHLAFASLGVIFFGEAYLLWPGAEEFEGLMAATASLTCLWAKFNLLPIWNKEFRKYRKMCVRLQALAEEITHLARQKKASVKEDLGGLLCYLDEVDGFVASGGFVIIKALLFGGAVTSAAPTMRVDEVRGHILALLCHSWTATSSIMSDLLLRLARHPDVQGKVHAEIDRICKGKTPTALDVRQMHYLKAALYESTRLDPCAPLLTRCSVDHDLLFADYVLPAGAILSIPVQALHTDAEECGQDAHEFHPERFLKKPMVASSLSSSTLVQENSGLRRNRSSDKNVGDADDTEWPVFQHPSSTTINLSYGSGERACPGQNAAAEQTLTLISCILQQYKIQPEENVEDDRPSFSTFTLIPRH